MRVFSARPDVVQAESARLPKKLGRLGLLGGRGQPSMGLGVQASDEQLEVRIRALANVYHLTLLQDLSTYEDSA